MAQLAESVGTGVGSGSGVGSTGGAGDVGPPLEPELPPPHTLRVKTARAAAANPIKRRSANLMIADYLSAPPSTAETCQISSLL